MNIYLTKIFLTSKSFWLFRKNKRFWRRKKSQSAFHKSFSFLLKRKFINKAPLALRKEKLQNSQSRKRFKTFSFFEVSFKSFIDFFLPAKHHLWPSFTKSLTPSPPASLFLSWKAIYIQNSRESFCCLLMKYSEKAFPIHPQPKVELWYFQR